MYIQMGASIRFFCVVGSSSREHDAHIDMSYEYLSALRRAQEPVRAITIGAQQWNSRPDAERWEELAPMFQEPLGVPTVNIVCAPPDMSLGSSMSRAALAGKTTPEDGHGARTAYVPATAFASLWTMTMYNIAIVQLPEQGSISERERAALEEYACVVTPRNVGPLHAAGVLHAHLVSPPEFPAYLQRLPV